MTDKVDNAAATTQKQIHLKLILFQISSTLFVRFKFSVHRVLFFRAKKRKYFEVKMTKAVSVSTL